MKIEFFNIETDIPVPTEDYFVLNGNEVWSDSYETAESQSAVVGFEDFIVAHPHIGWRIVAR